MTISELNIEIQNLELRLKELKSERQQLLLDDTAAGAVPSDSEQKQPVGPEQSQPTITLPHLDGLIAG
jgi:hypothetical protein